MKFAGTSTETAAPARSRTGTREWKRACSAWEGVALVPLLFAFLRAHFPGQYSLARAAAWYRGSHRAAIAEAPGQAERPLLRPTGVTMLGIPLALVTGGLFLVVATALVSRGSFETRHRKEATPAWQEQLNAGLVRTDHVIPYDSNAASEDDLAGTWVLEAQTGRGDDISETLNDARTGKWLGGSLSVVPAASGTYRLRTSRGVVFYIAEDDRITRVGPGHYAETHADPDNSDKYYTDLRVVGRKLTALRHEICQVHRYRPLMDPLRYEMWVTYVFHRK